MFDRRIVLVMGSDIGGLRCRHDSEGPRVPCASRRTGTTRTDRTRAWNTPAADLQMHAANSTVTDMVHDSILDTTTGNRRENKRTTTGGELVIDWHILPGAPGRYALVNESEGGCLVCSTVPLVEGMTGRVRTRLPDGDPGRVSVVVAWIRRVGATYHIGLRYFAFC